MVFAFMSLKKNIFKNSRNILRLSTKTPMTFPHRNPRNHLADPTRTTFINKDRRAFAPDIIAPIIQLE